MDIKNDHYYKLIKKFQENSKNSFIKKYDTDDVYYGLSRKMIGVMQMYFDSSSHQELQNHFNDVMKKHFDLLEKY